jgi:hypothetical protein
MSSKQFRWVTFMLVISCSRTPTPSPVLGRPAARDTTIVQRGPDNLEFSLTLTPVPRAVGDTMQVKVSVRNLGNAPRVVRVTPCYLTLLGIPTEPWPRDTDVCAGASAEETLGGGESWNFREGFRLIGPAGRYRLRLKVAHEPSVWLATELELAGSD